MPPRDLPGFYWDPQKNRYFHLPSRSTTTSAPSPLHPHFPPQRHQPLQVPNSPKAPVITSVYRSTNIVGRIPSSFSRLSRLHHQILCSQIVKAPIPPLSDAFLTPGPINAFNIIQLQDDRTYTVISDANCWLYSLGNGDVAPTRELKLPSRISSISSSGTLSVATTFGSPCKIVVQNAATSESFILTPGPKSIYDVWTSHLMGNSLALGMHGKGIYIPDVNASVGFHPLHTSSDVLAIYQEPNLVYTGTRGGIIVRWDTRTWSRNQKPLLSDRYKSSSITHLRTMGQDRLLVSSIDGRLELFDLRFPIESAPVTSFLGHVNSYSQKLALAMDPSERFIFAAGQDNVIRAWSLLNGQRLGGPEVETVSGMNVGLLNARFDEGVSDVQLVEDRCGLHFWYSTGPALCHQTIL
ncbi:WD40-repeat-containing domain protein [Thelephora terrestris]|uniref:WD40-repeat-containing domain protein n=1 Tax=Thelephora terrestris TaxID=56493 RepID=A0A9P6H518_9AGAM|nr:WD40-repeat-containing domain protein [Thelephora terrestris]